jgi:hypothetical protein
VLLRFNLASWRSRATRDPACQHDSWAALLQAMPCCKFTAEHNVFKCFESPAIRSDSQPPRTLLPCMTHTTHIAANNNPALRQLSSGETEEPFACAVSTWLLPIHPLLGPTALTTTPHTATSTAHHQIPTSFVCVWQFSHTVLADTILSAVVCETFAWLGACNALTLFLRPRNGCKASGTPAPTPSYSHSLRVDAYTPV